MIYYSDPKYNFIEYFNNETGFLLRSNILENGVETAQEPVMRSYPELIDIGIMGTCLAAKKGFCKKAGVDCYQDALVRHRPNMSFLQYSSIISQVKGKTFQVSLGGTGDPNKHESFQAILELSRENCIVPNLTTSGWLMSANEISLMRKYCGAVAVSFYTRLDSSENETNPITIKAISDLLAAGCQTNIHYVLSLQTINEAIYRLENDLFPHGINAVVFLLYKPVGQANRANILSVNNASYQNLMELIRKSNFDFRIGFDTCQSVALKKLLPSIHNDCIDFCEASRFSMYVDCDMLAYPCSFGHDNKKYVVDLKCHTLKEAWNSNEFNMFRRKQYCRADCEESCFRCGYEYDQSMCLTKSTVNR